MTKIKLSQEQESVRQAIEGSEEHWFITGKAGTGKSALLQEFRKRTSKNVVVSASTGIAALNVTGNTLHRLVGVGTAIPADLGIDLPKVRQKRQHLKNVDTIIIDEISMVSADLLDACDRTLRYITGRRNDPFGGIQIVMFGDPYQLPPVTTNEVKRFYKQQGYRSPWFFDAHVWEDTEFNTVELQHIFRQSDPTFKNLLNVVRDGTATEDDVKLLNVLGGRTGKSDDAVLLATTNKLVDDHNRKNLAKLRGRTHVYNARVNTGFGRDEPAPRRLDLKVGAHVMMLNNDKTDRWVNGSRGVIENLHADSITVRMDESGEAYSVGFHAWVPDGTDPEGYKSAPKFWQIPVKLAWAVTIHKSQGLSLPEIEINLGDNGAFADGQTYVALSRVTNPAGMYLSAPLSMSDIRVDPDVKRFFKALEEIEEEAFETSE